jgi:hypothetical protein
MKPARALAVFIIAAAGIRLRVRVLPTVADVDAEYRTGRTRRNGKVRHAFFKGATRPARCAGTVVLPARGRLAELIPHEACHVDTHCFGDVAEHDDEGHARRVGLISARITSELRRRGIEVAP